MFEVLNNTESTIEELTQSYVKAAQIKETLKTEHDQNYRLLMDIQKNFLDPDTKESKELKEARRNCESSNIKFHSCLYGMKQIKDRMIEQLAGESQERREEINQEVRRLREEEKDLMRRYLQKVAEAIAIEEEIKGIAVTSLSRDGSIVEAPFRNTELGRLSTEDDAFLRSEVEKHRQPDNESIDARIRELSDEFTRLEEISEYNDEQKKERIEEIIAQALQDTPPVTTSASS